MFTFIRMAARGKFSAPASSIDQIKGTVDSTTLIRLAQAQKRQSSIAPGTSPWDRELRRLQKRQNNDSKVFQQKLTSPGRVYLEPLASENPGPKEKQGTQTDLKIWWGKSVIPYTFDPQDAKLEDDSPKRKPNPWRA